MMGSSTIAIRMVAEFPTRRSGGPVVAGELRDARLSFPLREGFRVLAVVPSYLANDPESLGYEVVIEWRTPDL